MTITHNMISVDSILSDEHDLTQLNDLCRLCGNLKDASALIFDDVHQQHYDDVINIYFRDEFKICRDDILPQRICRNCLTSVESWNQFYINCVHVNEKYLQIIEKFSLTKEVKKKSNDMNNDNINTDIEVIEVGVEGDNYDFFNDQVVTNELDITNIKFSDTFPVTGNFQTFDNTIEDISYSNDAVESKTSNQLSTDHPEYNNGIENTADIVIGDDDYDGKVEDDVADGDETGIVDADCTENSTLPPTSAAAHLLDELQAVSNNSPCPLGDEDPDCTELDTGMILNCAICSNTSFSGQLIDNQYVCEACCNNIKIESKDDDQYINESGGIDSADDSVSCLADKMTPASALCDEDVNLTAMKTLPDEKYQCALCNKVYCKKKSMINHVLNHNKKIFTCGVCNSTFRTPEQLKKHKKRHMRTLARNTLIYCEICKKYFKTKKGFAYHQQKICIQYKCYVCDEKFLVHSVLLEHMRTVHDEVKKSTSLVSDLGTGAENTSSISIPANDNETVMSVCPICDKVVTQAVLPRHMVLHSEDKPFTCDLCGKSFKRKHSLQDHIMIEMGMKNYVCDICGMKFLKQGYLNKHVRYHQLNNGEFQGFPCEKCGKKFPEKWRLGVHQRSVHKGGRFSSCKCDICGKDFAERWMVRRHKAEEHNGEEFKEYKCEVCGKKFQEKWLIRAHQRSTHKSGVKKRYCKICGRSDHLQEDCTHRHAVQNVTCELCGDQFESNIALKEHITSHIGSFDRIPQSIKVEDILQTKSQDNKDVLHICSGCGSQFSSKAQLRDHEIAANCLSETKYECEDCGKVFHSKSSLSNHLMSHRKVGKPDSFKCDFCSREFRTSEGLESHMSADKTCKLCQRVYPCDDHLRNHVYKEHDDDDEDENQQPGAKRARIRIDESCLDETDGKFSSDVKVQKPFECKICHKKFARKQAMKNHFYAELNLRNHECEFCDKRYNYYSHLKEHIITNHGEKEYSCVFCGKDFPTRKRFRDHVSLHSEDKPFYCECGLSFKLNRYLSKHKKKCKSIVKKES